jgi:Metal binding domain of Ada
MTRSAWAYRIGGLNSPTMLEVRRVDGSRRLLRFETRPERGCFGERNLLNGIASGAVTSGCTKVLASPNRDGSICCCKAKNIEAQYQKRLGRYCCIMAKNKILSLIVLLCLTPLGLYFIAMMVNHLVLPPRLLWEHTQMVVTPVHGNRRSGIYHLPACPNYNSMLAENKVYFRSAAEAEKAGYRMALNCPVSDQTLFQRFQAWLANQP